MEQKIKLKENDLVDVIYPAEYRDSYLKYKDYVDSEVGIRKAYVGKDFAVTRVIREGKIIWRGRAAL